MSARDLETVIGLEVHVQLATNTKLFCRCKNEFGAPPNRNTCPICAGHPGVMPVPNERAIELGVRAASMLGCEIQRSSKFDRKHYFYPDQPKGYQISQYDLPYARGGGVELDDGRVLGLERIHLEEDAGKSTHHDGFTTVDLNRAGVPLIEIVGLPEIRSPEDAHSYLDNLRRAMRFARVSDCDMEKGSLRCDANISLRPVGQSELGTKVEIKNLNSFRMVERALVFEQARQAAVLAAGGSVVQETRLWDDDAGETRSMRSKEEAMDYRYFPEPDIPPLVIAEELIEGIRAERPEPHQARRRRFVESLGLSDYDASVLTAEREIADYFEQVIAAGADAKLAANWVMTEVLAVQNETGTALDDFPLRPRVLAEIIALVAGGAISHQSGRKLFKHLLSHDTKPAAAVDELGLAQISDEVALEPIVRSVIANADKAVADYKKGKKKALDAMKGMVMRETRGRANPTIVGELLERLLRD